MTQLTKEFFEKQLKTLATKGDLENLATKKVLDKVSVNLNRTIKSLDKTNRTLDTAVATLNRTTAFVANLTEDIRDLKINTKDIRETVHFHTNTMDKTLKNTEDSKMETVALRSAIRRHEEWITQIAQKLGMKLES